MRDNSIEALAESIPALKELKGILDELKAADEKEQEILQPFSEKFQENDRETEANKNNINLKLRELEVLKSKSNKEIIDELRDKHSSALVNRKLNENMSRKGLIDFVDSTKSHYQAALVSLDQQHQTKVEAIKLLKLHKTQNFYEVRKAHIEVAKESLHELARWIKKYEGGYLPSGKGKSEIKQFLKLVHPDKAPALIKPFTTDLTEIILHCASDEKQKRVVMRPEAISEQERAENLKKVTCSEEYANYVAYCLARGIDFSKAQSVARAASTSASQASEHNITQTWFKYFFHSSHDLEDQLREVLAKPEVQRCGGINSSVKNQWDKEEPLIVYAMRVGHIRHAKILLAQGARINIDNPWFAKYKNEFIGLYLSLKSFSFASVFKDPANLWLCNASDKAFHHTIKACSFAPREINFFYFECIKEALATGNLNKLEILASLEQFFMSNHGGEISLAEFVLLSTTPENVKNSLAVINFLIERSSVFIIRNQTAILESLKNKLLIIAQKTRQFMTNIFQALISSDSLPVGVILCWAYDVAKELVRLGDRRSASELFGFGMLSLVSQEIKFDLFSRESLEALHVYIEDRCLRQRREETVNAFWSLGIGIPLLLKHSTYDSVKNIKLRKDDREVFILTRFMKAYFREHNSLESERGVLKAWASFLFTPVRTPSLSLDMFLENLKTNKVPINYDLEALISSSLLASGSSLNTLHPLSKAPLRDYCHRKEDAADFMRFLRFCFFVDADDKLTLKISHGSSFETVEKDFIERLESLPSLYQPDTTKPVKFEHSLEGDLSQDVLNDLFFTHLDDVEKLKKIVAHRNFEWAKCRSGDSKKPGAYILERNFKVKHLAALKWFIEMKMDFAQCKLSAISDNLFSFLQSPDFADLVPEILKCFPGRDILACVFKEFLSPPGEEAFENIARILRPLSQKNDFDYVLSEGELKQTGKYLNGLSIGEGLKEKLLRFFLELGVDIPRQVTQTPAHALIMRSLSEEEFLIYAIFKLIAPILAPLRPLIVVHAWQNYFAYNKKCRSLQDHCDLFLNSLQIKMKECGEQMNYAVEEIFALILISHTLPDLCAVAKMKHPISGQPLMDYIYPAACAAPVEHYIMRLNPRNCSLILEYRSGLNEVCAIEIGNEMRRENLMRLANGFLRPYGKEPDFIEIAKSNSNDLFNYLRSLQDFLWIYPFVLHFASKEVLQALANTPSLKPLEDYMRMAPEETRELRYRLDAKKLNTPPSPSIFAAPKNPHLCGKLLVSFCNRYLGDLRSLELPSERQKLNRQILTGFLTKDKNACGKQIRLYGDSSTFNCLLMSAPPERLADLLALREIPALRANDESLAIACLRGIEFINFALAFGAEFTPSTEQVLSVLKDPVIAKAVRPENSAQKKALEETLAEFLGESLVSETPGL